MGNLINFRIRKAFFFATLLYTSIVAGDLSDSLFIENHFSQNGRQVSRRKVEKFLLDQNSSALFIDKSKGYWWSSWAIGATMWTINTGYSLYQAKLVYDAIQRQDYMSLTGANIDRFTVPLVIGGEISSFVQGLLRTRADYWLHKGVTYYNCSLAKNYPGDSLMDHTMRKTKSGMYMQDRVLMPARIVNPILRDLSDSRPFALWSDATDFLANQTIGIGGMFLALAIIGYMEQEGVDTKARDAQLTLGISLTSFGIINAIVSSVTRKAGIRRYNEAVSGPK